VARAGRYDITARLAKLNQAGTAQLVIGSVRQQQVLPAGATQVIFRDVQLPRGAARLECWWETADTKGGMLDVTVSHR
jgi:hypothetical protein